MGLDVRLPMGAMFVMLGAVLAVYGMFSDPAVYARSLNINVNLWWGLVIFLTGASMLTLVWRATQASKRRRDPTA